MTKANENARARVADAERRARRKIKRLQNKGVRTGSVEPFRTVDPSNTRALKSYARIWSSSFHVQRVSSRGATAPRYRTRLIGIISVSKGNGTRNIINIGKSSPISRL